MPFLGIVFDFDGTIVDTERVIYDCWREVFRKYGHDLPLEAWVQYVGAATGAIDPYQMLEMRLGRPVDRVEVDAYRRPLEKEMLAKEPMRPGISELIEDARRKGLRLAVASNSQEPWVTRGLEALGIAHHFETVCTPDDGVDPKPSPALYLLAVERLGIPPGRALAIEDSPLGAQSAVAAGLTCVVVPSALTKHESFPPQCVILDTLEGLDIDQLVDLGQRL